MPNEWISIAVQAGGAVVVCLAFLKHLKGKQEEDNQARAEFLRHLAEKDRMAQEAMTQQMGYLRDRDAQSKAIAQSGHAALAENTQELARLRAAVETT